MFKYIQEVLQTLWKEASRSKVKVKKSKGSRFDVTKGKTSIKPEILAPHVCNEKHDIENSKEIVKLKKTYEMLMRKFVSPRLEIISPSIRTLQHMTSLGNMKTHNKLSSTFTDVFMDGKKNVDKLRSVTDNSLVPKEMSYGWSGQPTDKLSLGPKIEISSCPQDIASAFFVFPELEELSKSKIKKYSKYYKINYKRKKYGKLNNRLSSLHDKTEKPRQLIKEIPKSLVSKFYKVNLQKNEKGVQQKAGLPENYGFPSTSIDKQNDKRPDILNSDVLLNSNSFKTSKEKPFIKNIQENMQPVQQLSSTVTENTTKKHSSDKSAISYPTNESNIENNSMNETIEIKRQPFVDEKSSLVTCDSDKLLQSDTSNIPYNTMKNEVLVENKNMERVNFGTKEEPDKFRQLQVESATFEGINAHYVVQNQYNERESGQIDSGKSILRNITNTDTRAEDIENVLRRDSLIHSAEHEKRYSKNTGNVISNQSNQSKGTVIVSNRTQGENYMVMGQELAIDKTLNAVNSVVNKSVIQTNDDIMSTKSPTISLATKGKDKCSILSATAHKSSINTSLKPNDIKGAPQKESKFKIQSYDYNNNAVKKLPTLQSVVDKSLNNNSKRMNNYLIQNIKSEETKRDSIIKNKSKQNIKQEYGIKPTNNTYSKIKFNKVQHSKSSQRKPSLCFKQNNYPNDNINKSATKELSNCNSIIKSGPYPSPSNINHSAVNKVKKIPDPSKRNKNAYWILLSNKACEEKDIQGDFYNSTKAALRPQRNRTSSKVSLYNDGETYNSTILNDNGLSQNLVNNPSKIMKQETQFLQDGIATPLTVNNNISNSTRIIDTTKVHSKEDMKPSLNFPNCGRKLSTVVKPIQITNSKQRIQQNSTNNSTTKNTQTKDDFSNSVVIGLDSSTIPLNDNLEIHTNNVRVRNIQNMTIIKPASSIIQEGEEQEPGLLSINSKVKTPLKSKRSGNICKSDYIKFVKNKAWYFDNYLNNKKKIFSPHIKNKKEGKLLLIQNKDEEDNKKENSSNINTSLRPKFSKEVKRNKGHIKINNLFVQHKKRPKVKNRITKSHNISFATIKKTNSKSLLKRINKNRRLCGLVKKDSTTIKPEMPTINTTHKYNDVKDQNIRLISSLHHSNPILKVYSNVFPEKLKQIPDDKKSESLCQKRFSEQLKTFSKPCNTKMSLNFTNNNFKSIGKERKDMFKENSISDKKYGSYTFRRNINQNKNNCTNSKQEKSHLKCFIPGKSRKLHSKKIESKNFGLKMYGVGKTIESDTLPKVLSLKSVQVLCKKHDNNNSNKKTQSLKLPFKKSPFQNDKNCSNKIKNNLMFATKFQTRNIFTVEHNANMIMNYLFRQYSTTINQYKLNKPQIVVNSKDNLCQVGTVGNISKILLNKSVNTNDDKGAEYTNRITPIQPENYKSNNKINKCQSTLMRKNVKLSTIVMPRKDATVKNKNVELDNESKVITTNLESQKKTDKATSPPCNEVLKKNDHNIVVLYSRNKTKDKPNTENLKLKYESNSTNNLKQSNQNHLVTTSQNTDEKITNKPLMKKISSHEISGTGHMKMLEISDNKVAKSIDSSKVPEKINRNEKNTENISIIREKCLVVKSPEYVSALREINSEQNNKTNNILTPQQCLQNTDCKMTLQKLFSSRNTQADFRTAHLSLKGEDQQNNQKWKSKTDRLNDWVTRKTVYSAELQPRRRTHVKKPIIISSLNTNIEQNKSENTTDKVNKNNNTNKQAISNITSKNMQCNNNLIIPSKAKKPSDSTGINEKNCNFKKGSEFKGSQFKQLSQISFNEKSDSTGDADNSKTFPAKDLAINNLSLSILKQKNTPINNPVPLEQENSDSHRRKCKLQNNKPSHSSKESLDVQNYIIDRNKNIIKETTSTHDSQIFSETDLSQNCVNNPLLLKLKNNYQCKIKEMGAGSQWKTDKNYLKTKPNIHEKLKPPLVKQEPNKSTCQITAKQSENTTNKSHLFQDVVNINVLKSQTQNLNFKKDNECQSNKNITNTKPSTFVTAEKIIKKPSAKDIDTKCSLKNNCGSNNSLLCTGEQKLGSLQSKTGEVNVKNENQPSQSILEINSNIHGTIESSRPSTAKIILPTITPTNNSKVSKISTNQTEVEDYKKNSSQINQSSLKDPSYDEVKMQTKNVILTITGSSNNKKILTKRIDTKPIFSTFNPGNRKFTKKVIKNLSNLYKRNSQTLKDPEKEFSPSLVFNKSSTGNRENKKTIEPAKCVEYENKNVLNAKKSNNNINSSKHIINIEPTIQNKSINKPLKINFTCTEDYKSSLKKTVPNNVPLGNDNLKTELGINKNSIPLHEGLLKSIQLTKNKQISPENKGSNVTKAAPKAKSNTNIQTSNVLKPIHSEEVNIETKCLMTPKEIKQMRGKINTSIIKMVNTRTNYNKCHTIKITKPRNSNVQNREEKKNTEQILNNQIENEKCIEHPLITNTLFQTHNLNIVKHNTEKHLNSKPIQPESCLLMNSNSAAQNIRPSEENPIKTNTLQSWRPRRRSVTLIKGLQ